MLRIPRILSAAAMLFAALMQMSPAALAGPWEDVVDAHLRGDDVTAARLVRPLAEDGNADAQGLLGFFYSIGLGVAKDEVEGVRWLRLAAEQGNAGAQTNLCESYLHGTGIAKDFGEAMRWCRLAAEKGYDGGQLILAIGYRDGAGVEKSTIQAYKWFTLASAAARHPSLKAKAEDALAELSRTMSPEEIAEAKRQVAAWTPTRP